MATIGQRSWLFSSILELSPVEWLINQCHELLINGLRQGPMPRHVAFIMDGNRRYAKQHRIESIEGHHLGYEALYRVLNVCYKAGIEAVTIYAFSMENFHRSKYEVDGLMDLMKAKFKEVSVHCDLMEAQNIGIRVLGRRDMLRQDVLDVIDGVVRKSAVNATKILNICVAYTARDEMATAARETVAEYSSPIDSADPGHTDCNESRRGFSENHITRSIQRENLRPDAHGRHRHHDCKTHSQESTDTAETPPTQSSEDDSTQVSSHINGIEAATSSFLHDHAFKFLSQHNHSHDHDHNHTTSPSTGALSPKSKPPTYNSAETITASTISSHMFTADSPPVDILIRTSNVQRLSDFMLWQCHEDTEIVFLEVLWPEFDIWSLIPVLSEWQWKMRKQGFSHCHKRRVNSATGCTKNEPSHLHLHSE